jgi:hypothetical protein
LEDGSSLALPPFSFAGQKLALIVHLTGVKVQNNQLIISQMLSKTSSWNWWEDNQSEDNSAPTYYMASMDCRNMMAKEPYRWI